MRYITTKQLMAALGVSRNFINQHMRHLGTKPMLDEQKNVSVFYSEENVIDWINQTATFSRQTEPLNLAAYASEELIEATYEKMEKYPNSISGIEAQNQIFNHFLESILPPEYIPQIELVHERIRGLIPWVPVEHKIKSLDQLISINTLKDGKSEEIAYRAIYSAAMIRVELLGRRWYVYSSIPKHYILMPAGYDKK